MRHAGTQTIETERLLLRPLTPEDAPMTVSYTHLTLPTKA